MKILLKLFSGIFLSLVGLYAFYLGISPLIEGRNLINPYIDTQFAENYTPGKFDLIKLGMTEAEVVKIIGEPISVRGNLRKDGTFEYTKDGKLMVSDRKRFFLRDFAWYLCFVRFENGKVVRIDKQWAFD